MGCVPFVLPLLSDAIGYIFMNKMMHIFGTIAIAVVVCLVVSYLTDDRDAGYTIREDLVVGDYIEYNGISQNMIIEDRKMSVGYFIENYIQYDVSSMEQGDDTDYEYKGENIRCSTYTNDGTTVLLAKGSDALMYITSVAGSGFIENRVLSYSFDVSKPVTTDDLREGMEILAEGRSVMDERVSHSDTRMTITSLDDGKMILHYVSDQGRECRYKHTIVSIDGDYYETDDGTKWTKDEYLEMVSYKTRFANISEHHSDMEVSEYKEYFDLEFKSGVFDVTEIHYVDEYGENVEVKLIHSGDLILLEEFTEHDKMSTYVGIIEYVDSSLLE